MNYQTHTPAPWIVAPHTNPKHGSGWREIHSTGGAFSPSYVGEALEKDAYLISAAPELLDALKSIFEGTGMTGENMDKARAAIAKAEGGGV